MRILEDLEKVSKPRKKSRSLEYIFFKENEYILNKYNITPNELLFLDDNFDNLSKAKQLGINAIKVTKDTNLFTMISKLIKNKKDVL